MTCTAVSSAEREKSQDSTEGETVREEKESGVFTSNWVSGYRFPNESLAWKIISTAEEVFTKQDVEWR